MKIKMVREATIKAAINELTKAYEEGKKIDTREAKALNHNRCLRLAEFGLLRRNVLSAYLFDVVEPNPDSWDYQTAIGTALSVNLMGAKERGKFYDEHSLEKMAYKPQEPAKEVKEEFFTSLELEQAALATLLQSTEREYTITISNKK